MKRIAAFVTIFLFIFCFHVSAQDVLHLTLNNRSIGQLTTTETPTILETQRSKYKNIKKLVLDFRQKMAVSAYKRTLDITDEKENSIYSINESTSKPGTYIISSQSILKKMGKENVLKVFLLQNPRDNRMMMPSRRNLLVEVHMK